MEKRLSRAELAQRFKEDIAPKVAADPAYQNAKQTTGRAYRARQLHRAPSQVIKRDLLSPASCTSCMRV